MARLAAAEGAAIIRAAMAVAAGQWTAQEHGAMLLAELASRPGALEEDILVCARLLVALAEEQLEKKCVFPDYFDFFG